MEQGKGAAFVVISGLIFFEFSRRVLLKVELKERELIRNQLALMRAERRALVGTFASSIAHDMNNILTIAGTGLEELSEQPHSRAKTALLADQVQQALDQMTALARRMLTLGKEGQDNEIADRDLLDVVRRSADFARAHQRIRSCQVGVSGDPGVIVRCYPRQIATMLLNLMLNAADATGGKGRLEVVVRRRAEGGGVVEVHDNGPGLPESIREKLFTPFSTTKANGTGLGLLSIKVAAEQHRGAVTYDKSHLGGACFRVALVGLPAAAAPRPV
jgi:two-component system sensor histidine kinase HydH